MGESILYLMIFFTIILFVLEVDTLRHQSCGSSGYLKYVCVRPGNSAFRDDQTGTKERGCCSICFN